MKHKEQLVVWMIWFAMLTSVNVGIVVVKLGGDRVKASGFDASLVGVFSFIALGATAASIVLRQVLLGGFRKGTLSLDSPQDRQRFVVGNVVCFALSELPGVLGLVVGLQGAAAEGWAPFSVLSFLLFWWHIPLPARFTPKPDERLL